MYPYLLTDSRTFTQVSPILLIMIKCNLTYSVKIIAGNHQFYKGYKLLHRQYFWYYSLKTNHLIMYHTQTSPPAFLLSQHCSNPLHNVVHAWNRHTVPQGFVSGGIRSTRYVCPPIGKTLQTLALKGCQAANQIDVIHDALIIADILVADALMI